MTSVRDIIQYFWEWTTRAVLLQKSQKIFWVGGFWHGSVGLYETTIFFCPALTYLKTVEILHEHDEDIPNEVERVELKIYPGGTLKKEW